MNTNGVIRVGMGRGFVMDALGHLGRIVITAAHCLPELPPAHGASYTEERTYPDLLGPLGEAPTVWAECLFVDPIADIAVLCQPDGNELSDEAEAYDSLVDWREPFALGNLRVVPAWEVGQTEPVTGLVLPLTGDWVGCDVVGAARSVLLRNVAIDGGMSGSPVVVDGAAVGVVGLGGSSQGWAQQASLLQLPAWLFTALSGDVGK